MPATSKCLFYNGRMNVRSCIASIQIGILVDFQIYTAYLCFCIQTMNRIVFSMSTAEHISPAASAMTETPDSVFRSQRILALDPQVFNSEEIQVIHLSLLQPDAFRELLDRFNYHQLNNLLDALIKDGVLYYQEKHGVTTTERTIRTRCENLLDYKERIGCVEPVESCLHEGCIHLKPACAVRKVKEDVLNVARLFEARKNRSTVPHVAIELFFKKLIEDYNCVGLILADKWGTPKVFTTDGSGVLSVISEGSRRLTDAITDREFRFTKTGDPYQVFNQKFHIDAKLAERLHAVEKNPDLTKFIKRITFSSIGIEIAHERIILSVLYMGDNLLHQFLGKTISSIERIKLETEPELRIRAGFGRK